MGSTPTVSTKRVKGPERDLSFLFLIGMFNHGGLMGRQQILADISEFKLDPKKAHRTEGKTRLTAKKKEVETKGVWEQKPTSEEEDLAYVRSKLYQALKVPAEFRVDVNEIETVEEVVSTEVLLTEVETTPVYFVVEELTSVSADEVEDQVAKKKTKKRPGKVT